MDNKNKSKKRIRKTSSLNKQNKLKRSKKNPVILQEKLILVDPVDPVVDSVEVSNAIDEDVLTTESNDEVQHYRKSVIEDILFKLPNVTDPIIGTPKQVQFELDKIALIIQKRPRSAKSLELFNKIHLYMHGYLIYIVLRQFPYIKGMQTTDIYQQTLIALWYKAIPNFRKDKGMSFLNFAKMCIRRHLITILNTSKTRQKDQSINQAISLDSHPSNVDEDSHNTFSNIIPDKEEPVDKKTANEEAYAVTRNTLLDILSDFERIVLNEYLATSTYKEIASNISKISRKRCIAKSVDNALLRIRKKALYLKRYGKVEEIPLFIV